MNEEEVESNQDANMLCRAIAAMDGKCKPPGSLGQLEAIAIRLAVLQGTLEPSINRAVLFIFAADHGFTKSTPGVSAYPREVSTAVFNAIQTGDAASAVLCKENNMDLILVDVGLDSREMNSNILKVTHKNFHITVLTNSKKPRGSHDFCHGPAMSIDIVTTAFESGREAVEEFLKKTSQKTLVIGIGELGIGNTTSAAALVCAVTGHPPELICGRGTGIDDAGLALKISTVNAALEKNKELINTGQPLEILRAVGGLEIAAMTGAFICAHHHKIAVIVDGFISGTAALLACKMNSKVGDCLFWSHKSAEQGAELLLDAVRNTILATRNDGTGNLVTTEVTPLLDLGLKLGEGTGAVIALPILRSAAAIMSNMAALDDIV